jgi:hypothetical protein
MRLTRRFGRPPFDPALHWLVLELEQVPGIQSLKLNGQKLAEVSPERSSYEIELDHSRDRNELAIEIAFPLPAVPVTAGAAEWGKVALVLRPIASQG